MKKVLFSGKTLDRNDLKNINGGASMSGSNCRIYDQDCDVCAANGCHCKWLGSGDTVCL